MIVIESSGIIKETCCRCEGRLVSGGLRIPGMRTCIQAACEVCGREYLVDLPVGHGLHLPMMLDVETLEVHHDFPESADVEWHARWLREGYAQRGRAVLPFEVETLHAVSEPLVLNCIDVRYGHCLLKLLNAQYYLDHHPELDVIVIIQPFMRWLVPEGVAAIWTVGLPLRRGTAWNDWLADTIAERLADYEDVRLSVAFSHPHHDDFDIERFTRVRPFELSTWADGWHAPKVTLVWRGDRVWASPRPQVRLQRLATKRLEKVGLRDGPVEEQHGKMVVLCEALRDLLPQVAIAVVGLGDFGEFPGWVTDMRTTAITGEVERAWCERYSASHVVVGVHGSNMLLPTAHAGGAVELMPEGRWGSMLQDVLFNGEDARDVAFRYRVISAQTQAEEVAYVAYSIIRDYPLAAVRYNRPWVDHAAVTDAPLEPAKTFVRLAQRWDKDTHA